ncbi:MAG: cupin domain-containing protein [Bdellovibrionales bacterium]|nr:cupin domain-containing protein [Bdellovibrionales bacterium]
MDSLRRYILSYSDVMLVDPKWGVGVAALGKKMGTKQVGVNVISLPPGTRSSMPHAESCEDEFGYVLAGNPSVWINGETYRLSPGHAIGFPSGTGVCHNVINDGPETALLVAIGERTKPENQYISPLNPEQEVEAGDAWWKSWPVQSFGPHPGTPGSRIPPKDPEGVPGIVFAPTLPGRKSFPYYKGSTETFSESVRLNSQVGVRAVGIHYEVLHPGKRSSWPHAESHEDEFCFVLRGCPTIWINGYRFAAKPGDLAFFEAQTNLAHTVINDTDEPIEYLGFGLTAEALPEGQIYYPFHSTRNEECRSKGKLWETRPQVTLGPDRGEPLQKI